MPDSSPDATSSTAWVLHLQSTPSDGKRSRLAAMALARFLRLELHSAMEVFDHVPTELPVCLGQDDVDSVVQALRSHGCSVHSTCRPAGAGSTCQQHPRVFRTAQCKRCQQPICAVCRAESDGRQLCADCARKQRRSRTFFRVRVAILLTILGVLILWALHDHYQREARTEWTRPLQVAVIVLETEPVDNSTLQRFVAQAKFVQSHLAREFHRYRPGADGPFVIQVFGPLDVASAPPRLDGSGWFDRLMKSLDARRYFDAVDDRAGVVTRGFDSRVYVAVRPAASDQPAVVEGASELGGRIGVVEVELDRAMVDFAWFVAIHELMHTLGASDKYDVRGYPLIPNGLAEPDRQPRFPQYYTEVMARARALSRSQSALPDTVAELRVGETTAREIGWKR